MTEGFSKSVEVIVELTPILAECTGEILLCDLFSRKRYVVKGSCVGVECKSRRKIRTLRAVLDNTVYLVTLIEFDILVG